MLLILDDNREVRHCLQSVFEHHGYIVATAANGAEALGMMDDGLKPDAIILDMDMPVMDGESFLAAVAKENKVAPIIVLSAFLHRVKEGMRSAVQEVIEKPVGMEQLLEVVGRWAKPDVPKEAK